VKISQHTPALVEEFGENWKKARILPSGDQEVGTWNAPIPGVSGFKLPAALDGSQLTPSSFDVRLQVIIFPSGVHIGSTQPDGAEMRGAIVSRVKSYTEMVPFPI
jgi:hypothetical protein